MAIIKLKINYPYLYVYLISCYLAYAVEIITEEYFEIKFLYVYLYSSALSQIFGGLLIYLYQNKSLKHKKKVEYFGLELIYNDNNRTSDSSLKIILLIFFASLFDFLSIFLDYWIDKTTDSSYSQRIGYLSTIISSLLCTYTIGFKTGKHQKISMVIMVLGLILEIILEMSLKPGNIFLGKFMFVHFLYCLVLIFISFNDCIHKYLVEVDFLNPFKLLMIQGIIELIMTIIISIGKDPLYELKRISKKESISTIVSIIFLLLFHFVFTAVINAYGIYCNVIYSPMTRSLMDYLLNPFLYIYIFIDCGDFFDSLSYFIIIEIVTLIINFFGCLYNEFIILFCCGLEYETVDEIKKRAENTQNRILENKINDDDSSDDSED